jgi:hypothetical protein
MVILSPEPEPLSAAGAQAVNANTVAAIAATIRPFFMKFIIEPF